MPEAMLRNKTYLKELFLRKVESIKMNFVRSNCSDFFVIASCLTFNIEFY